MNQSVPLLQAPSHLHGPVYDWVSRPGGQQKQLPPQAAWVPGDAHFLWRTSRLQALLHWPSNCCSHKPAISPIPSIPCISQMTVMKIALPSSTRLKVQALQQEAEASKAGKGRGGDWITLPPAQSDPSASASPFFQSPGCKEGTQVRESAQNKQRACAAVQ